MPTRDLFDGLEMLGFEFGNVPFSVELALARALEQLIFVGVVRPPVVLYAPV